MMQYIGGALVTGIVSLVILLMNRKWKIKDEEKALNNAVLKRLDEIDKKLEKHIMIDNERSADSHRARVLAFNNELLRNIPHTREEFIDILSDIDAYEDYCREHPDYQNNRAVHAIANIGRSYDEKLKENEFL